MESEKLILRNKKTFNKLLIIIPLTFIPLVRIIIKNFQTNEHLKIGYSVVLLLFCILMLIFFINAIRKINKNSPALIINDNGITDNISIANAGEIKWKEILRFEILKSAGHPHLFIFVENPEKFINNKSWFTKGMLTQLNKDKGSPIAIDLNQVEIDSTELMKIVTEKKSNNT